MDLLVGTNVDDWRLWLVVSGAIGQITDEILTGPVPAFGYQCLSAYGLDPGTALAAYRTGTPRPARRPARVRPDGLVDAHPRIRLADAHARTHGRASTYMYEFAWSSPGLGAVHALEVPFVFDTASVDAPLFGPLLGPDPPQELARTMHDAWVAFATAATRAGPGTTPWAGPRCGSTPPHSWCGTRGLGAGALGRLR